MPDARRQRGLLDTSVVVDIDLIPSEELPVEQALSAITLAELTAGPLAAASPAERARRQERLQWAQARFEAVPFDADAARAFGRVYASIRKAGRKARGRRAPDLFIAAIALSRALPLYTQNPSDFEGIDGLEVVAVGTGR